MSGRRSPSSPATVRCSKKSQCSTMPAISTTLRSCSSPHAPLVAGRLSAVARPAASSRSVPTPSPSWRTIARQLALRLHPLALQSPDLALHPHQPLRDRSDHALDLLGATRHLPGRPLLLGAAGVGHPPGQRLARAREHLGRQRGELGARPLTAAPQRQRGHGRARHRAADQHQHDQHPYLRLRGSGGMDRSISHLPRTDRDHPPSPRGRLTRSRPQVYRQPWTRGSNRR